MKKLILGIITLLAIPTVLYAQAFGQNQIIQPPYGGGVLISTSTSPTAKLGAVATSSLGLPTFSSLASYFKLSDWYATTTDGLDEGLLNLYFTNERSDDRTAALIQNGTGISWFYNDGAGTLTPTITLAPFSTTNLSEGSNLYYTDARTAAYISASSTIAKATPTNGNVLLGNGTTWASVATSSLGIGGSGGSGTVTSVAQTVPTGFTVTGSPVTTSGTLAIAYDTGYEGLRTASSTNWNNFYLVPSTRIGDGTGLTWSSNTLNCDTASGSVQGCLSSADWTTFNGKQAAGNYLTALTGDGTASGPGSSALTLATVNANTGSFGSSTSVPSFTVNGKGLITAASTNAIAFPFTDGGAFLYPTTVTDAVYVGTSTTVAGSPLLAVVNTSLLLSVDSISGNTHIGDSLVNNKSLEIEDGFLCVGISGCSFSQSDGSVFVENGIRIDSDGSFAAPNEGLFIGDGTGDNGTFEMEDGPACIGNDGCTPDSTDGSLIVEAGLTVGATAPPGVPGTTQGAFISGIDNGTAVDVRIPVAQASINASDTFIGFSATDGTIGSITGTVTAGTIVYNTFTGSHYTKVDDMGDVKNGYLLETTGEPLDKFGHLTKSRLSCTRGSKKVYGVYGGTTNEGYQLALSIGTGFMYVANKGDDLETGDLLMSSNVCGYAERQKKSFMGFEREDDTVSSITAAKLMNDIEWKDDEKGRYVGVIYLGG